MRQTETTDTIPVNIVGSSTFGRYPTISSARTYNMYISDGWLINTPGFAARLAIFNTLTSEGRGIFHSVRGDFMLAVVNSAVYRIDDTLLTPQFIGNLETFTGEVFIDENLSSQIAIVDGLHLYIYNYDTNEFAISVLPDQNGDPNQDLLPNYVTYQNTYFIIGNGIKGATGSQWFVYNSAGSTDLNYVQTLTLQTKPDYALAALRIPGKGNNLLVLGSTVGEIWTNVPTGQIYQRNSSMNIDYGCLSVSTIAASDEIIAWLAINEKSAPAIMAMRGGQVERISTDGIDYLLDNLKFPEQSTALFYRQDGHLMYQLTFFNPADDITLIHDFTTGKFFDLTDEDCHYHPARQVAYFENEIYFVSINDGKIYQQSSNITTYSYEVGDNPERFEIPRIRITDTIRNDSPNKSIASLFTFTIENGAEPSADFNNDPSYRPRIDVAISKSGGLQFGNYVPYYMHKTGHFKSMPRFTSLGAYNALTFQMRFYGLYRFVVNNGYIEVRQ